MSFTKEGLSPVMKKIVTDVLNNGDGEKIRVPDFRNDLTKLRISKDDGDEIIRFLQEKGYIVRRGKILIKL